MMDPGLQVVALLAIVALGAYTQAVAGFTQGLIVVGAAASLGVFSIAGAAALATVANLVMMPVALFGRFHRVRWDYAALLILGTVPAVCVGVILLDYLGAGSTQLLHMALAVSIVICGLLLTLKQDPRAAPVPGWLSVGAGAG